MRHHFLELNLEDHAILQRLNKLVWAEIKRSRSFVELSVLSPCVRLISQTKSELRHVFLDHAFDSKYCQTLLAGSPVLEEGIE